MQTVTETKKHFNTLLELVRATNEARHQLTAQEVINGRTFLLDGWQNISLSHDVLVELADGVSKSLGGFNRTKELVRNTIIYGRPQHWGLSRIFFREYEGKVIILYCAGQDYVWETKQIRNAIK